VMLVVQNLHKHFGGLAALDGASFEVAEGTITALIGPNGAGKTTLFNIVSGLLRPTAGMIMFKGVDVTAWPPHRIARAGMGRTFQNIQLFEHLNALENVIAARFCRTQSSLLASLLLLPHDRQERQRCRAVAAELLVWVGLEARRVLLPRDLPSADQLRLATARSLAFAPALLLMDAP